MFYSAKGELAEIAVQFHQFIETATKTPFRPISELKGKLILEEKQQVSTKRFLLLVLLVNLLLICYLTYNPYG